MGLKVEDLEKLSNTFTNLKKPRKKDPDAVKKMLGRFKDIFPPDKPSEEIIRELREKNLKS